MELRTKSDVRAVPCDCADGPCGWVHNKQFGPTRYFLNGEEVTMAEAKAAYYAEKGNPA